MLKLNLDSAVKKKVTKRLKLYVARNVCEQKNVFDVNDTKKYRKQVYFYRYTVKKRDVS